MSASEASGAVGAYEQLLVLLFDCSLLWELGECEDPGMKEHEQLLGSRDAFCRSAIGEFRRAAPRSELVHLYMLLLRTIGVALALGVDYVPLPAMFPKELLDNFPSLALVSPMPVLGNQPYSTVLYNSKHYCTKDALDNFPSLALVSSMRAPGNQLYRTVQYSTILHSTVPHCTVHSAESGTLLYITVQ